LQRLVQELVATPAVEILDEGILDRVARLDAGDHRIELTRHRLLSEN